MTCRARRVRPIESDRAIGNLLCALSFTALLLAVRPARAELSPAPAPTHVNPSVRLSATAAASDVGVVPRRLVVADRLASSGTARTMFVARDPRVTNGRALDVGQIRARLHLQYGDGAAAGAFVVPAGAASGWVRDDPAGTAYRNRAAPHGVTQMRAIVVRPGRLAKLRGAGLGDTPLDIVVNFPIGNDPETRARIMPNVTAHRPVNAIPAVCAAPPGIRTTADLPQIVAQLGDR